MTVVSRWHGELNPCPKGVQNEFSRSATDNSALTHLGVQNLSSISPARLDRFPRPSRDSYFIENSMPASAPASTPAKHRGNALSGRKLCMVMSLHLCRWATGATPSEFVMFQYSKSLFLALAAASLAGCSGGAAVDEFGQEASSMGRGVNWDAAGKFSAAFTEQGHRVVKDLCVIKAGENFYLAPQAGSSCPKNRSRWTLLAVDESKPAHIPDYTRCASSASTDAFKKCTEKIDLSTPGRPVRDVCYGSRNSGCSVAFRIRVDPTGLDLFAFSCGGTHGTLGSKVSLAPEQYCQFVTDANGRVSVQPLPGR